jgi:TatD DNase family protein
MIDVHCHLNFHAYEKDCDAVIKQAFDAGVETIINVGTKIDSSQKAVDLAQQYEDLYAIVGVHPHHADKHDLSSNWLKELEDLAKQPKVVAIGEIGLDYYRYQSNGIVDVHLQKEVFEAQIMLAHKMKLPLQIHNRHAGKDILEILEHHKNYLQNIPGMFHCFAGDMKTLKQALDLGFYIGFDGNSTYKGLAPGETVELSEIAKATPLDRILTETDSPFLTPEPHRGTRNVPAYVIIVGEFLAKIKGVSFETLQAQTVANAKLLFNIKAKY